MIRHIYPFLLLLALAYACTPEDDFITDSDAALEFSLDTLRFDTVFTQQGSATRILKVYNPHSRSIKIDRIALEAGDNSFFRINVDGIAAREVVDVEIAAKDSLYIFGEVTVDPDQDVSASPFVIEDRIVFLTNGNDQSVLLEAWGQNANYIPNRFGRGGIAGVTNCQGDWVWDDPKPYVIFGILFVDDCTLRIPAGTRVYVHGGFGRVRVPNPEPNSAVDSINQLYNDGRLLIGPTGKLIIEGTADNPVIIQGDRLEDPFSEVSGQWFGIVLTPGSRGNEIRHAQIKNSIIGVYVDSSANLVANSSQFYNTASSGIIGVHSSVNATNCLFYNNGAGAFRGVYGGDYNFDYCTMASFGVDASALSLSNLICLDQLCQEFRAHRLNSRVRNSIIYGSRRDEIILSQIEQIPFNYNFDHCVVRVDELDDEAPYTDFFDARCNNCLNAERDEVLFLDIDEDDYHLDTLSAAEGIALPIPTIQVDLDNQSRDPNMPDVGCYEYIYE
ncbi:MAG: hypothetical protein AAFV25_13040 [Bacteroidota bacterium]